MSEPVLVVTEKGSPPKCTIPKAPVVSNAVST